VRLTERKHEILRQFLDAIIKHFVPVFEVQFHIPSVFPQSQQVDGNLWVMDSHIPLHFGYPFLN
jgi:hypothetical protein